jgi:aryl carrier-like protein
MPDKDLVDQVHEVWTEVLDVPTVAVDVNFFDVGGDSVLLIVLLERLGAMTSRTLEPPDLFEHSTIRAQAELLAGESKALAPAAGADRSALLDRARRGN